MLEVQKYLLSGKTFEDLTNEFAIKVNYHPKYPLAILNYCQIDSPKLNPITMCCRGLVLDTSDYSVVAGCMPRFFNLGEALEITDKFDWNGPINSTVKEDGSLMTLFWNKYANEWKVKTRGSWADMPIGENIPRWDELFWSLLPNGYLDKCLKHSTYIFELCSMYNQVVRQYPESRLFLLTAINLNTLKEWSVWSLDTEAGMYGLSRPAKIDVTNVEAVKAYIKQLEETDGTAEGLVLQDQNGLRIKVKSATYLAYSRLGGNGNLATDKNLIPLILANEQDEAIAIFPAIEKRVRELELCIFNMYNTLVTDWNKCKEIEDQKEFAICITKTHYTPFNSLLFRLKKDGDIKDIDKLKNLFYNSEELILKVLNKDTSGK